MGSIAPSSGALLSSRSYLLSDRVYRVRRLCFLALSSVILSILEIPLSSSYSPSSVPLVMSHYAPPINDRNRKEKIGQVGGCFSKRFFSRRKQRPKCGVFGIPTIVCCVM